MIFSSRLSLRSMIPLCRNLATSHSAGIPILRSLRVVAEHTRDTRVKRVVTRMAESIELGSSLEQAARDESKYLPRFFVELVGAGEMGGRLDEIFESLADYYERMADLARRIVGKLIYPIAVFGFFLIVLCFMSALGAAATENGLDFSRLFDLFLRNIGLLLLKIGILLLIAIVLARMGLLGWVWGLFSTFVWPFGRLTRKLAISRFTRSLGLLLKSGVPVTEATRRVAATANNPYIERSLLKCVPAMESGESVSVALSQCPYLSDMAREMIYTGEEAGKLDQHLEKVANIHEAEAIQASNNLIVVMGVGLLLAVAIRVAVFVVGFWMSYFGKIFDELGV